MSRTGSTVALISFVVCGCGPQSTPAPGDDGAAETRGSGAWVVVPAGDYWVGSASDERCRDDDEERREVDLDYRFEIAATEVPRADFVQVLRSDPAMRRDCADCPIDSVTWHEAVAYCDALSREAGLPACAPGDDPSACRGYRLPTASEWEIAARAGSDLAFPGGAPTNCMTAEAHLAQYGWYKVNSLGESHPVGARAANAWGIFDMHGNVYEWTRTPAADGHYVVKGGAFYYNAEHARSANRESFPADARRSYVGFRCVRTLEDDATPSSRRPNTKALPPAELKTVETSEAAAVAGVKVASILYSVGSHRRAAPDCATDECALAKLVMDAATQGARLVVLPEYALGDIVAEPTIGSVPDKPDDVLTPFSKIAREHALYVVVQILTKNGEQPTHNSQIVLGTSGEVVVVHHKFELFAGERERLAAGPGATTFVTPFGTVGLLVCADMYGDPRVHEAMVARGASIIAVSSMWTADGAPNWPRNLAYNLGVAVVAANHTGDPAGGGGVFGPRGEPLSVHNDEAPTVAIAEVPMGAVSRPPESPLTP